MFFPNEREAIRHMYFNAWNKAKNKQALEPLEQQIVQVIHDHPEYHAFIESPNANEDKDFTPEMGQTNPFLHMGLHLALREQVACDRPIGIREVHTSLTLMLGSALEAEHRMMDCLVETLWQAQRYHTMPDEQAYLTSLQALLAS